MLLAFFFFEIAAAHAVFFGHLLIGACAIVAGPYRPYRQVVPAVAIAMTSSRALIDQYSRGA